MNIGVMACPTDEGMDPAGLACAAEARGFESLFIPDHSHIPVSRRSPFRGGELPRKYTRSYDPFIALSAAAAVTSTIKLGTGICLVVQRDPIITAKEVATIDQISGGRFVFGVGAGWNREEMENHGTDPRTRMRLMRERILAMKEIWTRDSPEFHGHFVDFDPIWCWPKPLQEPYPPILVAGMGPGVENRVLDYADGWMPIGITPDTLGIFADRVASLHARAADLGRAPLCITAVFPPAAAIGQLAELGVDRCVFEIPAGKADVVLSELDTLAELIAPAAISVA